MCVRACVRTRLCVRVQVCVHVRVPGHLAETRQCLALQANKETAHALHTQQARLH